MKRAIGIVLLIIATNHLYGQRNVTNQDLIWYSLFTTLDFNEKWYYQNEIQERHFVNPTAQHQFLIRGHIHRIIGKNGWETSLGMCVFLQNPNDPHSTDKLTVPELRPHIEFAYKPKSGKITFDHRYRAEARFYHNTNATRTALEDDFNFGNFRFRYRLQSTIPLFKIAQKKDLKLKISDEIHLNAGNKISKNVFEQNRIYGGISYNIFQNLTADIGYLNWFQQRPNGDFYNRNIISLSLFHKVDLTKKKE